MLKTRECCLCSQVAGEESNDLIARMLPGAPYVRRVMLESESFAAIPSLGPLVSGHALLCPKAHVRSFARLGPGLEGGYRAVKDELREGLSRRYDSPVHLFEHGMAAEGDHVMCSTDHAHLHFVPLPRRCDAEAVGRLPWVEFDGSLGELARLTGGLEYIQYEPPGGGARLLLAEGGGFESQFMRKLFALSLGRGENWNWRDRPDPRAADETWRQFAS